jgi:hypothetical protein
MDKNREAFTKWWECSDITWSKDNPYAVNSPAWVAYEGFMFATAAAEFERNNLLAVIAEKDKALLSAKHAIKGREHTGFIDKALSISPDNCKLVSVAKTRIVQTAEDEYDLDTYFNSASMSIVGDDTTLYAISTINDTISGRDGE